MSDLRLTVPNSLFADPDGRDPQLCLSGLLPRAGRGGMGRKGGEGGEKNWREGYWAHPKFLTWRTMLNADSLLQLSLRGKVSKG